MMKIIGEVLFSIAAAFGVASLLLMFVVLAAIIQNHGSDSVMTQTTNRPLVKQEYRLLHNGYTKGTL